MNCTFMPWILDSLDQPRYGSESNDILRCTPSLVSKIDYGFDQWSIVSFVIKTFFMYLWWRSAYSSYTNASHANIFLPLWFGNKFTDFCVFPKFLLTLHTRWNIKESKILKKFKTQFEGKQFKSDYEQQSFVL